METQTIYQSRFAFLSLVMFAPYLTSGTLNSWPWTMVYVGSISRLENGVPTSIQARDLRHCSKYPICLTACRDNVLISRHAAEVHFAKFPRMLLHEVASIRNHCLQACHAHRKATWSLCVAMSITSAQVNSFNPSVIYCRVTATVSHIRERARYTFSADLNAHTAQRRYGRPPLLCADSADSGR